MRRLCVLLGLWVDRAAVAVSVVYYAGAFVRGGCAHEERGGRERRRRRQRAQIQEKAERWRSSSTLLLLFPLRIGMVAPAADDSSRAREDAATTPPTPVEPNQ